MEKQEGKMKKALITGVTGQDGAYLAEFLLHKGYEVHGVKRRASLFNTGRIDHLYQDPHDRDLRFRLHYGDMTDANSLIHVIQKVLPDEIYNLAAQSHVGVSFESPEYTANVDGLGTLRILDAIRVLGMTEKVRFYQASTSELFGQARETPQKETTQFHPRSPYGVAKLYGYWITVNYREAYGMFACNGILFNHESPVRGETFVTRKITRGLARIKVGLQECLFLGNLDSKRDWGHARDYVEMQWLGAAEKSSRTTTLSPPVNNTSVRDFVKAAAENIGMELAWRGARLSRESVRPSRTMCSSLLTRTIFVLPKSIRYWVTASKARTKLGWAPKITFRELGFGRSRPTCLASTSPAIGRCWFSWSAP